MRQRGSLGGFGHEVHADMGQSASSGSVVIDVVNRNENEKLYTYRCMKVNLSVVMCRDMNAGLHTDHLSFVNNEQIMFSTAGFDIATYLDGSSPFGARVIVRNTSGDSLFYSIQGGL